MILILDTKVSWYWYSIQKYLICPKVASKSQDFANSKFQNTGWSASALHPFGAYTGEKFCNVLRNTVKLRDRDLFKIFARKKIKKHLIYAKSYKKWLKNSWTSCVARIPTFPGELGSSSKKVPAEEAFVEIGSSSRISNSRSNREFVLTSLCTCRERLATKLSCCSCYQDLI